MRFRSKPTTCEATQFLLDEAVPRGVFIDNKGEAWVITIHGQKTQVAPGDWIITEPDGIHYYPCKPDIFEKRWEPERESQVITKDDIGVLEL